MATDWVSPTGHEGTGWNNEANAYDDDTNTYASSDSLQWHTWSDYLVLTRAAIVRDRIRFYKSSDSAADIIDLDVYKDGAWVDVFQGTAASMAWVEKTFTSGSVTKLRVRFYSEYGNDSSYYQTVLFREADFGEPFEAKASSDTGSGVESSGKARTWGSYLDLIIATITAYRVRFMALKETEVDYIDLDIYYGSAWHDLYQGTFDSMTWVSKSFDQQTTVTKARVRFYQDPTYTVKLYELEFYAAIT